MAKVCCIEGCSTAIDGTFFKFPNSRTLRRKWMDIITTKHNNRKLIDDSLVCSMHFLEDQYEVVRGKTRLKAKVIPSLFVRAKSPKNTSPAKSLKENKKNANREKNNIGSECIDQTLNIPTKPPDRNSKATDVASDQSVATDIVRTSPKTNEKENGDIDRSSPDTKEKENGDIPKTQFQEHCDLENKDIEDIITNYLIKQTVPNKIHSPENIDEVAVATDSYTHNTNNCHKDVIEINDESAEPQFIEISADKGQNGQPDGQDCLMVLENVQVEIDPNLIFPEYDDDDDENSNDSDVIDLGEKKEDPISLLTSSDDDEVIIEEPKIDTVDVSDETDEDDVPLVKLVKTNKSKKSSKKEKKGLDLKQIMWGNYEYYCVQCHFTTPSHSEFRRHKNSHSTVFEVCQVCNFTTPSKSQFIRHKRKHKFEKRYQCHLCEYKAKHHMSLLYHMKTHSALGMDYDKCSYRSSDKSDFLEHFKQKYYKCDQCMYKSLRRSDLKRHKRRIHQDDDDDQDIDYTPG